MPRLSISPGPSFTEFRQEDTEQSIAARFERQADQHGNRIAVRTSRSTVSYEALNCRANQIAHTLLARQGIGSEPVVLLLEHDVALIAAILGALKCGRSYIPLDPLFPRARNRLILDDSKPGLVITDAKYAARVAELVGNDLPVLNVEEIGPSSRDGNLGIDISPDSLAYILYTSGSMGKPKGVMQTHRTVLHNVLKYTNGVRLGAEDRLTLLSSCSFGASVTDLFGALLNGAALFPFNVKTEGLGGLAGWLNREQITIWHSVPTLFRHFVDALPGREQFPRLRLIKLGGELVTRQDVERYKRCFPHECILYVGLGATEMNIIRRHLLDHHSELTEDVVPVGYAVEDTEVLLLDDAGAVVAPTEKGEIAIRSRYLSPGYWRQPELTRAVFLPDADVGERIYRTGDLGQLLPDGCLVYLGRKDGQVKIRGHRVELTEIETALMAHAAIREAVVVARENPEGEKRLVAYLVPARETLADAAEQARSLPSVGELRALLEARLPEYMIPSAFAPLAALPLTPTGKVDRSALADLGSDAPSLREAFTAPQDALEVDLCQIWETVLEVRPIGVRESFFALGGHSLAAARMFAEIEKRFGRKLPLATLLQAPTVEQLAGLLRQDSGSAPWSSLVALQPGGSRPPFFCIHGVGGHLLSYRELAQHLPPDQPVYGLQTPSLDGKRAIPLRVEEMAARYLEEIRRFQVEGPYFLGGLSFGGAVAYEIGQQLHAQGQAVALLALFDTPGPRSHPLPLLARVRDHLAIAAHLGARAKLTYALARGRGLRKKIARRAWQLAYRAAARRGNTLPLALRSVAMINRQANREYRREPYPGRLTVFRARRRGAGDSYDPLFGWGGLADRGVEIIEVPGDHETMVQEPHVQVLAAQLTRCLDAAQGGAGDRVRQTGLR